MKTRFTLLIVLFSMLISHAQLTLIPDENFEIALIELGLDYNVDGSVLTQNIASLTTLDLTLARISDLSGIEDFVELDTLILLFNFLKDLDIRQNFNLVYLDCTSNDSLSSILLSTNSILNYVNVDFCILPILDLSELDSLRTIIASNNEALTCFTIKNGNNINIETFLARNCPNLTCIEVDDSLFSLLNWPDIQMTPATYNEDCNNECSVVTASTDITFGELRFGPNPTTERLTISLGQVYSEIALSVYSISGQKIITNNYSATNQVELYIQGPDGIYLLDVRSSTGERSWLKVIKQ